MKHFYSNVEKLRLYYYVSNFAINQPMLPVISDPGSEHPDPVFPTVPGVPGRVGKECRARRPKIARTAVLGVDGRAL